MKATLAKITKRIEVKERKVEGIYGYDIDNNYPARVKDIVNNSSMGKSCVNLYKKFIYGNGFSDENLSRISVNRYGLTLDKLLYMLCNDFAFTGGFALHLNFNALYEISEINFISISQIRMTMPDSEYPNMFAVYKDWGEKNLKKDKIYYINKFNPQPEVILKEVEKAGGWQNYRGQVFYFSLEGENYPMPLYDAVLEDMMTDSQVKTFKNRNVSTNFMASYIVETEMTEDGNDEYGHNNRDKGQLQIQFEEFQGADNASKIMVVEKSHPDQLFKLNKVDIQDTDKLFEWTENSTRDNIRQSFLIPPVLLQMIEGKLGTADEIIDATKYYNSITEAERIILSEALLEISKYYHDKTLQTYDFTIEEKKAIIKEDIPKELMADLTSNERRLLIGYPELTQGSTKTLAEVIGVGGIQAMLSILTDTTLTTQQKINSLQVIFSISEEQANKMLNDGTNNISTATAV